MNQLSQSYSAGELNLQELAVPTAVSPGVLLVRTGASLVSVGTEKAMIDVARKPKPGELTPKPVRCTLLSSHPDRGMHRQSYRGR